MFEMGDLRVAHFREFFCRDGKLRGRARCGVFPVQSVSVGFVNTVGLFVAT
jgi:hypothetical protein